MNAIPLPARSAPIPRRTVWIDGQESYLLSSRSVALAMSVSGGMLGPVSFFPEDGEPIRPYAIAPWANERLPADVPEMLASLRGDWFCSAFGENAESYRGRKLPPHGETANRRWRPIAQGESLAGRWMRLGLDLPLQGGRCESLTALVHDHSIIYQRHDLSGLSGPINPGHHATLAFPDDDGAARLSFSRHAHARTYFESVEPSLARGASCLKRDVAIESLTAVPCVSGAITDLTRYPARRGFEDIAIVCADPSTSLAWSAVTFPGQGYVWFALRNPKLLASTLLWFSNGGRHYSPWNGRHVNVLGVEDVTAFFHVGLAASCRPNLLTERGIRTCLQPGSNGDLSIPYIQGVARIPEGFDRVSAIEGDGDSLHLHSQSGLVVTTGCHMSFLRTGQLPHFELP